MPELIQDSLAIDTCAALVPSKLVSEEPPVCLVCPKVYLWPGDWCRFRTDCRGRGMVGSSTGLGRVGSGGMDLQEVPDDLPGGSVGRGGVVTPWGLAWDWGRAG